MSEPSSPTAAGEIAEWEPLSLIERRILGVLVEKAKTTPDSYPLTLNALVTGCNQKSNRDPVMSVEDAEVEEAVGPLKKRGYMQQILGGGRVDKFRHVLYEALRVDKVQLAILGELFLRGPQTEGELRTRASRMEPIADLDVLRASLKQLQERGLVVYLTEPHRRGAVLTHGFHPPDELARLRARSERMLDDEVSVTATPSARPAAADGLHDRVARLESEIIQLRQEMASLRQAIQGG